MATKYTVAQWQKKAIEAIEGGSHIAELCKDSRMPSAVHVRRAIATDDTFKEKVGSAYDVRVMTLNDMYIEISQEVMETFEGMTKKDKDSWILSKQDRLKAIKFEIDNLIPLMASTMRKRTTAEKNKDAGLTDKEEGVTLIVTTFNSEDAPDE